MESPARYLVTFRHASGGYEELSVWDRGPEAAIQTAIDWIDYSERRSLRGVPAEATRVGETPTAGDLNVADSTRGVFHRVYGPDGRLVRGPKGVDHGLIRRATEMYRQSMDPKWKLLRESLRAAGVDPARSVCVTLPQGDSPAEVGRVVTEDGRTFAYHFGQDIEALRRGAIVEKEIGIREITGEDSTGDEMAEVELAGFILGGSS